MVMLTKQTQPAHSPAQSWAYNTKQYTTASTGNGVKKDAAQSSPPVSSNTHFAFFSNGKQKTAAPGAKMRSRPDTSESLRRIGPARTTQGPGAHQSALFLFLFSCALLGLSGGPFFFLFSFSARSRSLVAGRRRLGRSGGPERSWFYWLALRRPRAAASS